MAKLILVCEDAVRKRADGADLSSALTHETLVSLIIDQDASKKKKFN